MTKQQTSTNVYKLKTGFAMYGVLIERLKNTYSGNPRWKAHIWIEWTTKGYTGPVESRSTYVFTFTGHYMSEIGEAAWIIDYLENKKGWK